MKKVFIAALLSSMFGLGVGTVLAATDEEGATPPSIPLTITKKEHLFEERAGSWKATCDEMEQGKVYCRMFHIEQFGEWKTKNFVQMGPAWTPDAVGFVVATYLGFKEGTTVTVGIDKHPRHELTAPKGNNLMLSPERSDKILEEMASGNKIVLTFNSHSGVRHLSLAELGPYQALLAKVKSRLAKNGRSAAVNQ